MATPKPRETYHHGDLESALLRAATKMVRAGGAEHLSLRAVAAEVGVSPSAAYHYYPDKDSLIADVGRQLFEDLADYQEGVVGKIPGKGAKAARARFRALGRTYFEWAAREPNFFRLIFGGYCSANDREVEEIRANSRAWKMLQKSLEDLSDAGLLRLTRPYAEILTWSAVHGATALIIEGHLPKDSFEFLLDGLERSIGVGSL
ncbi:MAG: TetR/AcrR family transcriptional regulator [Candidatus Nanopelagicaceae bacterium]|nr:TetR/AcrR family transcriptional regulator [Candidatus Nanopelagicaceae bacterium]